MVDEQQLSSQDALIQERKEVVSNREVTQSVVSEAQFAGVNDAEQNKAQAALRTAQETKESEEERLKLEARETKVIPVKVTLNADQLNSVEVGAGYGSDSGARLRAQYRRAIVNRRGHSFDANFELSEIRQSIDGRYNIPYKHPLNDYISLVGGMSVKCVMMLDRASTYLPNLLLQGLTVSLKIQWGIGNIPMVCVTV